MDQPQQKAGAGEVIELDNLRPVADSPELSELCQQIAEAGLPFTIELELRAFLETRTHHDATRLVYALRYVADRHDLADQFRVLTDIEGVRLCDHGD